MHKPRGKQLAYIIILIHEKLIDFRLGISCVDFTPRVICLQLSSGDGLPSCICHRCLYKVELCLEFKQQCLMSDATLRQVNGNIGIHRDSDQECEESSYRTTTVSMHDFEKFTHENQKFIPDHGQNVENVVMVVNPELDYESENESDLEQHNSDVENADVVELSELRNVFMCRYCDRAYTDKEVCRAHETNEHNVQVPFLCAQCDMAFADRTNYTAHLKSVHQNDKPFGCPQCPRSFNRRSDLRKHTVVHTGIKPFTCKICFKSFSRNTNLTKHLRIHSGDKPYVCPQCPKTFISKGDLTRHALIHSGHKPFACAYCEQSFGRRDKLLRHEKKHFADMGLVDGYGGAFEAVKQEMGGDEDAQEDGSWPGENMVINVDPFNHEEENKEEDDASLPRLPDHITGDGDAATAVDYEDIEQLKSTVHAIKKYPCFVCHKRFSSAESLRFHAATHSGKKPHVCAQCHKTFLRKRELDRHMTTHTGMKPFKCLHCEKRFGRKDKLVRHARIHSPVAHNLLTNNTPAANVDVT